MAELDTDWDCMEEAMTGRIVGLLVACSAVLAALTSCHAPKHAVESGVRITQRPPDAYLGNRDLSARGDFDNDGRLDEAFFLLRTGDNGAMVIALVVSFGSTRTPPGARLRIVDTFVNVSERDIRDFGLRVARPGQYTAACARGYGDPCRDDEEEELALARDGVYFYDFESSSRLYYLPEGAQDGDFKSFWLSD